MNRVLDVKVVWSPPAKGKNNAGEKRCVNGNVFFAPKGYNHGDQECAIRQRCLVTTWRRKSLHSSWHIACLSLGLNLVQVKHEKRLRSGGAWDQVGLGSGRQAVLLPTGFGPIRSHLIVGQWAY